MTATIVTLPAGEIVDWESFHDVFKKVLGFPESYGRNMNAWIDCMTYRDEDDGMSRVVIDAGALIVIEIENPKEFMGGCAEQFAALVECTAFVNTRRVGANEQPILALMPIG
jgi:hypothetical protein